MSESCYLRRVKSLLYALLAGLAAASSSAAQRIVPRTMKPVATVDERFQSFNVEMVEVTGGRFWKPYKDVGAILNAPPTQLANQPAGIDPRLFQQRAPIDLSNARLRTLAAALGPAYLRVSGTWANTIYFHDAESKPPVTPPAGFNGVLTRGQWKGVVDFSRVARLPIVTSFAVSEGTRNAAGVWTPAQARAFVAYTKSIGGTIAAAEFMNEPTYAVIGGVPKGYDAVAYGRDLAVFRPFLREALPDAILLGPGSVGEGVALGGSGIPMLKSEDLLVHAGAVDAFSYHFYGGVSQRCGGGTGAMTTATTTTAAAALSEDWLTRTQKVEAFYRSLRDKFQPGKPIWLTETADAACGGNPWGATFLDSFRDLEQLGRLAQKGVQVVAHNTLTASDYGLIDETTLTPRPNYWAALLWKKLMGTTVLQPDQSSAAPLHLYAHCMQGRPGGVVLLAINTDRAAAHTIELSAASARYTLSAHTLESATVQLNGRDLAMIGEGIPSLLAVPAAAGTVTFAPASITFLAMPSANNVSCTVHSRELIAR